MPKFLNKYHFDIFVWSGLLLTFLVTRLTNLGIIPIFTDEAIYLRWSQIMASDAALRFLPLTDGKPPLFMWLTSVAMKLLPGLDPLLSGRLVSVFAGLGGLVGIYFASFMLFRNKKVSYLSSIFYLLSSFTFFYDRFATADSLLAVIGIWSLGLSVLLVRTARLDVAIILGLTIGFGLLTKSPALFFLLLLPISLLVGKFRLRLIPLFAVVVLFAQAVYAILRLFPLFNMIDQKNHEFILTFSEFFHGPFQLFWGNLKSLVSWEVVYLTVPVAILLVLAIRKHQRQVLVLSTMFLIHLTYMCTFNKVIYPRFLLTFTPYLLIIAASALSLFSKKNLALASIIVFAYPAFTIFKLIFDPVNAPLLQADRDQYLDGWSAGFGVKETRAYLATLPGHNIIATEGTFGLMPYSLELYQKQYPNLEIKSYWPLPSTPPLSTDYLLMYQSQKEPEGWKLLEILRFRQGLGQDYLRLYKVLK